MGVMGYTGVLYKDAFHSSFIWLMTHDRYDVPKFVSSDNHKPRPMGTETHEMITVHMMVCVILKNDNI